MFVWATSPLCQHFLPLIMFMSSREMASAVSLILLVRLIQRETSLIFKDVRIAGKMKA